MTFLRKVLFPLSDYEGNRFLRNVGKNPLVVTSWEAGIFTVTAVKTPNFTQ
jgi:hypothetical protein